MGITPKNRETRARQSKEENHGQLIQNSQKNPERTETVHDLRYEEGDGRSQRFKTLGYDSLLDDKGWTLTGQGQQRKKRRQKYQNQSEKELGRGSIAL